MVPNDFFFSTVTRQSTFTKKKCRVYFIYLFIDLICFKKTNFENMSNKAIFFLLFITGV